LIKLDRSKSLFRLTRYGMDVVLTFIIVCVVAIIASVILIHNPILKIFVSVIFVFLFCFTLYFFRDPNRNIPNIEKGIICPADGKICSITKVTNDKYLEIDALQVSIFMSPLNVHVNRAPINAKVSFKKHLKGSFHVAYVDKASELNEQTIVIFDDGKNKILMKQIAGAIARRIVNILELGNLVRAGDKIGMIKFGSRVDLLLPSDSKIKVSLNDTVIAGETVIGFLP
jgi:phosphatidylserine decarboxylase